MHAVLILTSLYGLIVCSIINASVQHSCSDFFERLESISILFEMTYTNEQAHPCNRASVSGGIKTTRRRRGNVQCHDFKFMQSDFTLATLFDTMICIFLCSSMQAICKPLCSLCNSCKYMIGNGFHKHKKRFMQSCKRFRG